MELGVVLATDLYNPEIGALRLNSVGDEVIITERGAEVCQRIRVALSFFKGEWFLDVSEGMPYYQEVLVKGPKDPIIRSVFSQAISNTEGVKALLELSYEVNKQTRTLSVAFKALVDDGSTLDSTDFAPFLIDLGA